MSTHYSKGDPFKGLILETSLKNHCQPRENEETVNV